MRKYLSFLALLAVPGMLMGQAESQAKIDTALACMNGNGNVCRSEMPVASPKKHAATADTTKHFEVGMDAVVSQTGDSLPGDVRIGLLLGKNASIEYSASAQRTEGYLEVKAELGVLASVIPGSSNRDGAFVRPHVALHYDGGPSQFGYGLGGGVRTPMGEVTLRMEMYVTFYQATKKLSAFTDAGAKAGVSYYF